MRAPVSSPVIIAAGGTGGHFFPAEALAHELQMRGERVVLITDARSGGLSSSVFAGVECHVVAGAGLSGRSLPRAVSGAAKLLRGTGQARQIMAALRPGAVVAFGGYPAIAPVLAAISLRRSPKIFLHEQNAVLGRANRFLARWADVLLVSFANTRAAPRGVKTELTGNPVRPAIAALSGTPYAPPTDIINILVLGGSLGAKIFGALIPAAFAVLPANLRARLHVVQQCRAQEHDDAAATYAGAGIAAVLSPFFNDMAAQYQTAHLVIARAGASSVAEIAIAGRPAVFIPLPSAIDDHQRANADALADVGAAWRLDQHGLTPEILSERLEHLLSNPTLLTVAARAAGAAAHLNAAAHIATLVQTSLAASTSA
ncbi:MAG: undecaprenyldiphospho-muramoylpentapeptide beta-N-acetylglucosaminyltransferase [Acidocella sp.]|nr:undecaprenyldiphospho-muramoylpentapeptide beta-N-acetylglucosaminyltransferase [Acidocella sp.]